LIHGSLLAGPRSSRLATKIRLTAALAALILTVLAAAPAQAQAGRRPRRESTANRKLRIARTVDETYSHPWEAAGGGGYMRYRSGPYLRHNNEVSFWAATRYSFTPRLGLLGTVQGAYGRAPVGNVLPGNVTLPYNPQISEYAFLAGPSYRFIQREKYSVAGFVQGGMDLGKFDGASLGFSATQIGVWPGNFAAAFSAGATLDYNIDPSISLRIMPMYLGTTFGSTIQNAKALNVGIVYRFGKAK
jgi:hypothetical protein